MQKQLLFLGLLYVAALCTVILGNPIEGDEDDEDIIKHFESLLKGMTDEPESIPNENESFDKTAPPQQEAPPVAEEDDGGELGYPENSTVSKTCECKKYFECNVKSGKGNTGSGPNGNNEGIPVQDLHEVDVRWGDSIRSPCGHYFDICCDSIRDNMTDIRNPNYQHTVCGKRNLDGVGFHVKGTVNQESQFGEFPWMAAIVTPERQNGRPPINVFVCGGSLIHPNVVLTAAHCVQKRSPKELIVRLGEWDTQTTDEIYPHKDHSIIKVVIHEDFYVGALYNDIALLFLNEGAKFAPHIDTVCLPPTNFNFDGQRCYSSGFGKDSFGSEGRYQVILKKLDLPVVSRESCEYALRRTRLGRHFRLHDSFVCAGGEKGRDTCRGDGGSPLVCNVPGSQSYVQYGIVAWGIGCGDEGLPGVYVNVPKFVPWISKQMSQAKLDTSYYKLGRKLF